MAALLVITQTGKEPRRTSTGEGLNTVVHPCHEVLLNYKKE